MSASEPYPLTQSEAWRRLMRILFTPHPRVFGPLAETVAAPETASASDRPTPAADSPVVAGDNVAGEDHVSMN
jgi:hypothetical protein